MVEILAHTFFYLVFHLPHRPAPPLTTSTVAQAVGDLADGPTVHLPPSPDDLPFPNPNLGVHQHRPSGYFHPLGGTAVASLATRQHATTVGSPTALGPSF